MVLPGRIVNRAGSAAARKATGSPFAIGVASTHTRSAIMADCQSSTERCMGCQLHQLRRIGRDERDAEKLFGDFPDSALDHNSIGYRFLYPWGCRNPCA